MWQSFTLLVLFALMAGLTLLPIPAASTMIAAMGFVLLAAFTAGEFFKRVGLPALLGYIVAGIVFGPDLAAIVFGADSQLTLLPADFTGGDKLKYVEILTVGVIGTLGGGELKIADLKDQIGTILMVVGFSFAAIFTLSAGTVYALAQFFPSVVPFLSGVDSTVVISVSLLFGVFGFAMSPAATLAIIQETKAEGPFTSLVLGIVIVAELTVVAAFLLTFAFSEILIEQGSLAWGPLMAELPVIGAEFMWALIIGAVTGVLFILYFRFVAREMIFFTVGVIFVAYYVCGVLHAEKLLAFITAGFIVQNLSKHGHDMIEALERISLPVFVVYFTIRAADLDLGAVNQFIVVTVILTAVRTGALWLAVRQITARLKPDMPRSHKKYLWVSFFSRGSVDLVLVGILAARTGPGFGWTSEFEAVIMAMIVVHIVAGPPILKLAFEGVGETSEDDETEEEEPEPVPLESEEGLELEAVLESPFPVPEVDDPGLATHLQSLSDKYRQLWEEDILQPIEQRNRSTLQLTERVEEEVTSAFDDLNAMLREHQIEEAVDIEGPGEPAPSDGAEESTDTDDADQAGRTSLDESRQTDPARQTSAAPDNLDIGELVERVRKRHMRFRQALQPQIEVLQQLRGSPVSPAALEELLDRVRGLEGFETHFRVRWGIEQLQPRAGDGPFIRLVKTGRRIYDRVVGSGYRTIPLGRLWRYFVELSVPGRLDQAASEICGRDERFWYELGEHIRRLDQLFERVVLLLARRRTGDDAPAEAGGSGALDVSPGSVADVPGVPMSTNPAYSPFLETEQTDELPDSLDIDEENAELLEAPESVRADAPTRLQRAIQAAEAASEAFEKRSRYLAQERSAIRRQVVERFTLAMRQPYLDFIDGLTHAGTIRLPAFRYRPSTKFDSARRDEASLLDRLARHNDTVEGYRSWMVVDQQLVLFLHWFHGYRDRITGVLDRQIRQQCLQALRNFESRCSERPKRLEQQALAEQSDETGHETDETNADDPPTPDVDWPAWLDEQIKPSLSRARSALNSALVQLSQGSATQQLMDVLESRVQRFPDRLHLLDSLPRDVMVDPSSSKTVDVPFRGWFMAELIREAALRFVEFNEHAERSLRRSLVALEDVEQILEFHLRTAQHRLEDDADLAQMNDLAHNGLGRAAERIRDMSESLLRDEGELRGWILREMYRITCAAGSPFFDNDVSDIPEQLRRHHRDEPEEQTGGLRGTLRGIGRSWERTLERIEPVFDQLSEDLRDAISEGEETADRGKVRRRLQARETAETSSIPVIYRRLFTPIPVDIPDFYIERQKLEQNCMEAVLEWFRGQRTSILIHGDRGMGKRTLIHHLLPLKLFESYDELDDQQLMTVSLGERIRSERHLCDTLAPLVDDQSVESLGTLAGRLRSNGSKRVVFVENASHLFSRTPHGVDLCRRFLQFTGETSDSILWIVMLGQPAATFLETTLDLFDYFTHTFEVEPLDADQIEEMITTRHRVSGFHLNFEPPESRLADRILHPLAASETSRHPRRAYFERLGRLSGGNPMLALLYWLESVHPDPDDDTRFIVEPLPRDELALSPALSLTQQLIVATIIQHGTISVDLLAKVIHEPPREVRVELDHLIRMGFVEVLPGRRETYRLRALAEPLVTRELRARNML